MLADGPGNFECSGVRFAALRQDSWQHLKDQAPQDVAGDEGKNNARTVFDNLSPFDPGSWQYWNLIVKPGQKFYHEMNNCATLAKDNDFFKLRKQMAAVDGDDKMLAEAKAVFKDKCFTTQQVKNLGALFLTDAGKLNFFVAGYYHVSDKNNYNTLQSELREETYISQFKAMLTQ